MSTSAPAPIAFPGQPQTASPLPGFSWVKTGGLVVAIAVLVGVLLLPPATGLPPSGQVMLAILAFAVVVWMTEALDYSVSAVVIAGLMCFLLAAVPDPAAKPGVTAAMGTAGGLKLALSGFSNGAAALVAAACFIASAMTTTHLDKRIALTVLSKVGAKTNRIVIGAMITGFLLAFVVPSTTARVACLMPIIMGFILAFNVDRTSRFAGLLVIVTAQTASIWNVGIKTAAAQNMVATGFIEKQLKVQITWGEWFVAAAPFAAIMTIALYFIMTRMMKAEVEEIAGGQEAIRRQLAEIGPTTKREWWLLAIMLTLLGFWATEKVLHDFDTTSTTLAAIGLMLLPGIGVMTWKESQKGFPWGTVLLFAVGISVGTALLQTKAAAWLANLIVLNLGLENASAFAILMLMSVFLVVIHLGFASATALASAIIPIVISVLLAVKTPNLNVVGLTMLLQFVVSFGFILPVNAPQNMIAYGTGTFAAKDFMRTGLVITAVGMVLLVVFAQTYWSWMGYMVKAG